MSVHNTSSLSGAHPANNQAGDASTIIHSGQQTNETTQLQQLENSSAIVPADEQTNDTLVQQEAPAAEAKAYSKYWNTFTRGMSAVAKGVSLAAQGVSIAAQIGGAVSKRATLHTISTFATWFDYKTEVEEQRKYISDRTGSWHTDLIVSGISPKVIDAVINYFKNPDVSFPFKTDIVEYIEEYKEYFGQIVEITGLRLVSTILGNVEKEWHQIIDDQVNKITAEKQLTEDQADIERKKLIAEQPFMTYVVSALMIRYNSFFSEQNGFPSKISKEDQDAINANVASEERVALWKERFGRPFVDEIIKKFLPDQTAVLPLVSGINSILKKYVMPRILEKIIDFSAEQVAKLKDILSNPEGGNEIESTKRSIAVREGGTQLLSAIQIAVDQTFSEVPKLVDNIAIPLAGNKAAEFIVSGLKEYNNDLKDPIAYKRMQSEMNKWVVARIQSALKQGNNSAIILPLIKEQIQQFIVRIIYKIDNYKSEKSIPVTIFEAVSAKFTEFFAEYKEDLLAFDEELKTMDEVKRSMEISKKYAPLCKQFLKSLGMEDQWVIEKVLLNFLPEYFHAAFQVTGGFLNYREMTITDIVSRATGDLSTQVNAIVEANKQFVDDASAALGHYIGSMVREQLQASDDTILNAIDQQIQGATEQRLSLETSQKEDIKDALNWFTKSTNEGIRAKVWGKIDELIQMALLGSTQRLMENGGIGSEKAELGDVLVLLIDKLNASSGIEQERIKETRLHRKNLAALAKEKNAAKIHEENTRHAKELGRIFTPFVNQIMGALSLKDQQAVLALIPKTLQPHVSKILSYVWEEQLPQMFGKMFEKTKALSDDRDELREEVTKLYNSGVPALYAEVQAKYLKAFLPGYIKGEIGKAGKKGTDTNSEPAIDAVIKGMAAFYRSKGAKIANLDKTTGQRVADYIEENASHLSAKLAESLAKTGKKATLDGIADFGVDYVESLLLQVFKGLHNEVHNLENNDPAAMVKLLRDLIKAANISLGTGKGPVTIRNIAAPETGRLLDRITKLFGVDMQSAPLPDQGKKALWDLINEKALPAAFSNIVSKLANEKTLNKIILGALESTKNKENAKNAIEKDVLEQHIKARRKAIQQGKDIPLKKKIEMPTQEPKIEINRDEKTQNELSQEFSSLLSEIAIATKDPIIRLVLNDTELNKKVANSLAGIAYDNVAGKTIQYTVMGLEAALGSLNLAEEVNGQLETIKKVKVVHEGLNAHLESDKTGKRIKEYKFNFEEKSGNIPVYQQDAAADDVPNISQDAFSFKKVVTGISELFNAKVEPYEKLSDSEKITTLLNEIGLNASVGALRNTLTKMWEDFQDSFYSKLKGIPHVGHQLAKWKLKLDDFCWAVFSATIGKLFFLITWGANKVYENRIRTWYTRVFDKTNEIFGKELVASAGYSILEHLEKKTPDVTNSMPKAVELLA